MKIKNTLAYIAAALLTVGCAGEDDSSDGDNNDRVRDSLHGGYNGIVFNYENIAGRVVFTNMKDQPSYEVPDEAIRDAARHTLRIWDIGNNLIPVKTNGLEFAIDAINEVESETGMQLFDRSSIEGLDDSEISGGIIFREGTAINAFGEADEFTCGNIGDKDGNFGPSGDWFTPEGIVDTVLVVNVKSSNPESLVNCFENTSVKDMAIHELYHALGMHRHFDGYAEGDHDFVNPLQHEMIRNMYQDNFPGADISTYLYRQNN